MKTIPFLYSLVVFGGYSAKALASRILDGGCKLVLTADGSFRGTKLIELKNIVDQVGTDGKKKCYIYL